jgi:hypothetical protein
MPKALFQKVSFSFCYLLYPSLMPYRLKDNLDFFKKVAKKWLRI